MSLTLKNQLSDDNFYKYTTSDINKFHSLLDQKDNLRMIMGINLSNKDDRDRDLGHIDFGFGNENTKEEINNLADADIKWYQINYDWNNYYLYKYLEKYLAGSVLVSPKFNEIIFDNSTTKFINKPTIILYLYYILLKVGGTLYIENLSYIGGCVGVKFDMPVPELLEKKALLGEHMTGMGIKYINKNIPNAYSYTIQERMENDRIALSKVLLNSEITNFYNDDNYPINNVKNYHKIVKSAEIKFPIDNIINFCDSGRSETIYELKQTYF